MACSLVIIYLSFHLCSLYISSQYRYCNIIAFMILSVADSLHKTIGIIIVNFGVDQEKSILADLLLLEYEAFQWKMAIVNKLPFHPIWTAVPLL